MPLLTLRWHRVYVPEYGITNGPDVPLDPQSNVVHLCRYPNRCCTVCDRHREPCGHPTGRRSW
jgi:hypothetical protein